jgi:hypothetical protein
MAMAEKVVSSKTIGPLSVSIDENGTVTMVAETKSEAIVLKRPQAQELLQWLSTQRATLYELTKQGVEQNIGPLEEPDFGWQHSHPYLEEGDDLDIFPISGVV